MASNELEIEPFFSDVSHCVLFLNERVKLFSIKTNKLYKDIAQTMFQNQVAEVISALSILFDIHDYLSVSGC